MLIREIDLWWKLRHPHVLPVFGACLTSTQPYIISQFMENGDLVHYLRRFPQANRVKLVRFAPLPHTSQLNNPPDQVHEINQGLSYLHSERVVHGDLKSVSPLSTSD